MMDPLWHSLLCLLLSPDFISHFPPLNGPSSLCGMPPCHSSVRWHRDARGRHLATSRSMPGAHAAHSRRTQLACDAMRRRGLRFVRSEAAACASRMPPPIRSTVPRSSREFLENSEFPAIRDQRTCNLHGLASNIRRPPRRTLILDLMHACAHRMPYRRHDRHAVGSMRGRAPNTASLGVAWPGTARDGRRGAAGGDSNHIRGNRR